MYTLDGRYIYLNYKGKNDIRITNIIFIYIYHNPIIGPLFCYLHNGGTWFKILYLKN